MSLVLISALVCTVALLVTHAYFLLGSIPLLVLKHDTPMDARFVRAFFRLYHTAALYVAGATAISLAVSGRWVLAGCAAALALLAAAMRRTVLLVMDALQVRFGSEDARFAAAFRRLHVAAILINLAQLALIVGCLIVASARAMRGA